MPDAPASRWAEGSAVTPAPITPAAPPPITPAAPAAPVPPVTPTLGSSVFSGGTDDESDASSSASSSVSSFASSSASSSGDESWDSSGDEVGSELPARRRLAEKFRRRPIPGPEESSSDDEEPVFTTKSAPTFYWTTADLAKFRAFQESKPHPASNS